MVDSKLLFGKYGCSYGIYVFPVSQLQSGSIYLQLVSNFDVNTLKLKLKVYTPISFDYLISNPFCAAYRANMMKTVSLSKYFRT